MAVGTFTIDAGLVGKGLVKDGDGLLALSGVNSYSCSTTVNGGELQFQNGSALPLATTLVVNAGTVDLGGGTTDLTMVTLCGGSIADGTLQAQTSFVLYSGSVLADLAGPAAVEKLGPGTVVLAGHDTYQGGTIAIGGHAGGCLCRRLARHGNGIRDGSCPAYALLVGPGRLDHGPMGAGRWNTTPWLDGASVVIATGSDLSLSGPVDVNSITVTGDATIGTVGGSGTISIPGLGRDDRCRSRQARRLSMRRLPAALPRQDRERLVAMVRWPATP